MARQKDNQSEERPFSYIKKPLAALGYPCLGLTLSALFLGGAGMALSVRNQGNTPMPALANEVIEKHNIQRIGMIVSGLLLIWWLVMILLGVKR